MKVYVLSTCRLGRIQYGRAEYDTDDATAAALIAAGYAQPVENAESKAGLNGPLPEGFPFVGKLLAAGVSTLQALMATPKKTLSSKGFTPAELEEISTALKALKDQANDETK